MVVIVTGANGQLGQSLQFISGNYPQIQFHFYSSIDLDITNKESIEQVFKTTKPNFCINTAAYTEVDKAESEEEKATLINCIGAKNLAQSCKGHNTVLIHISTDFVFDGTNNKPYKEDDITNPQGIYAKTKLDGELVIQKTITHYFIIRTSWVYSQFGNNFMKTMLRLGQERSSLNVVNDQVGTPTNAIDLAEMILTIIVSNSQNYGIYNFSNEGSCSWFDFAKQIFENNNVNIELKPIPTTDFPTPAKRPKYSVLDKSKIKNEFKIKINSWQDSLKKV